MSHIQPSILLTFNFLHQIIYNIIYAASEIVHIIVVVVVVRGITARTVMCRQISASVLPVRTELSVPAVTTPSDTAAG